MTPSAPEQGMTVRREVLGDEHVDRAVAATTPFTAPFQDLITRYAWGEIWSRPGLSRPSAASSRWPCWPPCSKSTSWPCTSRPRCATA
jgi:hypothetical protein